jgi:hypothetical protein
MALRDHWLSGGKLLLKEVNSGSSGNQSRSAPKLIGLALDKLARVGLRL